MKTALLVIDIQNDYFPGGKLALPGSVNASLQAKRLLEYFRSYNWPVIYIQHISTRAGASFFLPGTSGAEIHSNVQPLKDELVLQKHFPNSFRETNLRGILSALDASRLVICGMQTHMCIDSTTRAAFDLGYECYVVADACASRDLVYADRVISADTVHCAFLAALQGLYGKVMTGQEFITIFSADS